MEAEALNFRIYSGETSSRYWLFRKQLVCLVGVEGQEEEQNPFNSAKKKSQSSTGRQGTKLAKYLSNVQGKTMCLPTV